MRFYTHRNRCYMKTLLLALIGALSLHFNAFAQQPGEIDMVRMQRDLDIMEMVIDRLLHNRAPYMQFPGAAANGTFLPDFGVLLQVPTSSGFEAFEFSDSPQPDKAQILSRKVMRPGNSDADDTSRFRDEVLEFFSNWADAMGQLHPDDRIAVYGRGGPEISIFLSFGDATNRWNFARDEFFAYARKADIDAVRTGKLSKGEFEKRVEFKRVEEDQPEIEIMAGALDAGLTNVLGAARGLYVEGYGAVFFANADFGGGWVPELEELRRLEKKSYQQGVGTRVGPRIVEEFQSRFEMAAKNREKNWQAGLKDFRDELGELLTDYGHALKAVRPSEWVVVTTHFQNPPEQFPQQLICRVKKQSVDEYRSGKMTRAQLLRLVRFDEQ